MPVRLFDPLRIRDFRLLWTGMAISMLGDGIYFVAIAFQAYALKNEPSALGLVGLAWTGGMVLFLIVGGVVADRRARRSVMMAADVARMVVLAAIGVLSVTGELELWMLVTLAGLYGAGEAFFGPAFSALIPEVVPPELLIQANAIEHGVRPLASQVAGPAVGGVIVALVGPGTGFLIDAGTFAVSFACLAAMRVSEVGAPAPPARSRRSARGSPTCARRPGCGRPCCSPRCRCCCSSGPKRSSSRTSSRTSSMATRPTSGSSSPSWAWARSPARCTWAAVPCRRGR